MTDQKGSVARTGAKAMIEVWMAAVLMVVSFAVGFAVRGVTTEKSPPAVEQQMPGTQQGVIQAPPLTNDQLQSGLPQGHPQVAPPSETPGGGSSKSNDKNNNNP